MSLSRNSRTILNLTPLDNRITPASITVKNTSWDPTVQFSLPWAIAQTNSVAMPGQDTIVIDYSAPLVGANPVFNVPVGNAAATVVVKEGVVIEAGGGSTYATFMGGRPFEFLHDKAGAAGTGLESVVRGGVFDQCSAPGGQPMWDNYGGAFVVSDGTVTVQNTRFTNNFAVQGGAIAVDTYGKLVLDADMNASPPAGPNGQAHPEHSVPRTLFKSNTAIGYGGAVWSRGKVVLGKVWFTDNQATGGGAGLGFGGGLAISGGTVENVSAAIPVLPGVGNPQGTATPDLMFARNTGAGGGGRGGAIYYSSASASALSGLTVIANTSRYGGGIYVARGTLGISDSTVMLNVSGPQAGAGIHIEGQDATKPAKVVATRVKFDANSTGVGSGGQGTGVAIYSWAELESHGCDFSGNNGVVTTRTPQPGVAPPLNTNPYGVYTPDTDPNEGDVGLLFYYHQIPQ